MSIGQLTATVSAPVNQGVAGLAQQVQAWLLAHPHIDIQDVDYYRPQSTFAADQMRLRIAYTQSEAPSVGAQWSSVLVQTEGGTTAQQQFNTLAAFSGMTLVPFFVLDVTNHERGRSDPDSVLVIGVDTEAYPRGLVGHSRAAFIGQPEADIAPGALGSALIIDAAGRTLGAELVYNIGSEVWVQDERNYIVFDESSGELVGLPSCAAAVSPIAPVSSTTTTLYPCPAYLPGAAGPA